MPCYAKGPLPAGKGLDLRKLVAGAGFETRDLWVMSKTVLVHAGSPRPCCPACALLYAPRCLATSRVALPVHGVSTTRATTPDPGDQHHSTVAADGGMGRASGGLLPRDSRERKLPRVSGGAYATKPRLRALS